LRCAGYPSAFLIGGGEARPIYWGNQTGENRG
jgi:hypothetical protein